MQPAQIRNAAEQRKLGGTQMQTANYQDKQCLTGKNLGSAVVEELLQCLALCRHFGHVFTHAGTSLHTGIGWKPGSDNSVDGF